MIELNAAQLLEIDDGMIHSWISGQDKLMILKKPLINLGKCSASVRTGYLSIENKKVFNEGGVNSEIILNNFHGEIIII